MKTMHRERESLFKRILGFRFLFIINGIVLLLFSFAFGREYLRNREIQGDISRLQEQAEELAARNLQITELKTAFQTESFVEREARLKLGMKKPGEQVVVIQREEEGSASSPQDPLRILNNPNEPDDVANPTKWWYYFFDKTSFDQYAEYVDKP